MSLKARTVDLKGKDAGVTPLSDDIFGVIGADAAIFDVVLMQRARARQGTAKTKTRSEVRGGGKKPYKQKGTGNARQGSSRSPLLVGGGVAFGPRPRSYQYRLPSKVRSLALRAALSQATSAGKLFVVKDFKVSAPKTKEMAGLFNALNISKGLVVDIQNDKLARSVRNLKDGKYLDVAGLNVFDVMKYENVLVSSQALPKIEERLAV